MLVRAAREASMEVTVIRVGQVSGGINGYWKPSDWVPAIVKSGRVLGCLPRLRGVSGWFGLVQGFADLCAREVVLLGSPRRSGGCRTGHYAEQH